MKRAVTMFGVLMLVLSACAAGNAAGVGVTHTTSGEPSGSCLRDELDCVQNTDCCSFWCVNGQCELREP